MIFPYTYLNFIFVSVMNRTVEKHLQTFCHRERKKVHFPCFRVSSVLTRFLYIVILYSITSNFYMLYGLDARHVELVWLVYMGCFLY